MKNLGIFWLFFSISILQVNCSLTRHKVSTNLGVFIGRIVPLQDEDTEETKTVSEFLSVPYAKPPLNDLRFRKPQPITKLPTNFYKCDKMPKHCYQFTDSPFRWTLSSTLDNELFSEDCLYMNIWVPSGASKDNKKSVFFWIHGGGASTGSISQDVYNGEKLAALGDIIVVTVNYRLGITGYWGTGTDSAPGNLAIWDVIQALKWVNQYIADFGGDKNSITIAGQGSGAVMVSLLSIAEPAEGLFKRQIVQSGSAMYDAMDELNNFWEFGETIARQMECQNTTQMYLNDGLKVEKCMREEVYDDELLDAERRLVLADSSTYTSLNFRWGDELFPRTFPRETMQQVKLNVTDLLIGNNGNEGDFLLEKSWTGTTRYGAIEFLKNTMTTYGGRFDTTTKLEETAIENVFEKYFPKTITKSDDLRTQVARALGDFLYICPTIFYASLGRRSGANVYYYEFNYNHPHDERNTQLKGNHFDEVYYVFGHPIRLTNSLLSNFKYILVDPGLEEEIQYKEKDVRLSRMIIRDWSNFVKFGKPNDKWPKYKDNDERYVYVNDTVQLVESGYGKHYCTSWWDFSFFTDEDPIVPTNS